MNNKERIESLLEGLNQVSQNVNRFKTNLKWEFKYVEDKYFIDNESDIGLKLSIVYKDVTINLDKVLLVNSYERVKGTVEELENLRAVLYHEFIKHLLFLIPQKYSGKLGDMYVTPVRDLIKVGWEKCIETIDENELRSNSENKE